MKLKVIKKKNSILNKTDEYLFFLCKILFKFFTNYINKSNIVVDSG